MFNNHVGLDQLAEYVIKIQGRLAEPPNDWFLGEVVCVYENGVDGQTVTCLTGTVADQAALHGLLTRIRDLGLELESVNVIHEGGDK